MKLKQIEKALILDMIDSWNGASPDTQKILNPLKKKITKDFNKWRSKRKE